MALTGLAVAAMVGLVAGLVWGLGRVLAILSPVLWPIAVAGVLAYLLDPVVDRLERLGLKRPRAIMLVFALALLLLAVLFGSVVPQVVHETRQLAIRIPQYTRQVQDQLERWVNNPPPIARKLLGDRAPARAPAAAVATNAPVDGLSTNLPAPAVTGTNAPALLLSGHTLQTATSLVARALPRLGSWLLGQAGRVASWFGVLAGLALIPVYLFYFLLEKQGISSRWTNYLPVSDSSFKNELVFILSSINNYLIAFFRGQVLVAVCDGILYSIGFLIIGLPYAVLIGVMAVFLTIIPYLGAIIICLTALVLALVQYGDALHPALVLCVIGVVQVLEGLVISPRIMGDRVGLHPVTIIIAVITGTTLLGGILGGILAIPLTAALRVLMFRYVWKRSGDGVAAEK